MLEDTICFESESLSRNKHDLAVWKQTQQFHIPDTRANEYRICLHQHWGLSPKTIYWSNYRTFNKDNTWIWPAPRWPVGLTDQSTSPPHECDRDSAVNRKKTILLQAANTRSTEGSVWKMSCNANTWSWNINTSFILHSSAGWRWKTSAKSVFYKLFIQKHANRHHILPLCEYGKTNESLLLLKTPWNPLKDPFRSQTRLWKP